MKINEFIEEYKQLNNDVDKVNLINSLITTKYVSYATKIADCKRIIDERRERSVEIHAGRTRCEIPLHR